MINDKKVLILGNGLLGSYLHGEAGWDFISRKTHGFDFSDIGSYSYFLHDYEIIVNCIAYCKTYDADRYLHWNVNYKGVVDLVDHLNDKGKKLVHISTDYIYSNSDKNASETDVPVHCNNWYGYTKLLSDGYVQLKSTDYLLLRGTHKKTPFPYQNAYINQIGNFDYVDVIGNMIIRLIRFNSSGVFNIGTELKTMYDLAKQTRYDVNPTNVLFDTTMPSDVSINLDKLDKELDKINETEKYD